jgi:radical SAM superfamily enzyme YgiQ (UPF0313 family)
MKIYENFWFAALTKRLNSPVKYLAFSNIILPEQYNIVSEFAVRVRNKFPETMFIVSCDGKLIDNTTRQIFDYILDLTPGELVLANLIKPGHYEYSIERMEFRNTEFYKKYNYPLSIMSRRRICINRCLFCSSCTNDLLCKQLGIRDKRKLDRFASFAEDIEYYVQKTGIRKFYILDNILNMSLSQTKIFLKSLLAKNLGIEYYAHVLLERADAELFRLLKQSGCTRINVGIDSGSARFLRFLHGRNKRFGVFTMVRKALRLKNYGFRVSINLIYAYPYETTQDFLQTLKLLRVLCKNKISEFAVFRFYFHLQSEFALRSKKYHLKYCTTDEFEWAELGKSKETVVKRGDIYSRLIKEQFKELQNDVITKTKTEQMLAEFLGQDIIKSTIQPVDRNIETVSFQMVYKK